tara:strand:+ start:55 stop:768 length:714 start_codon:yes stop_codon:yes gene_type:complete
MTTIENIHDYLKYHIIENEFLCINWDCKYEEKKKELNDLMGNEHHYDPTNGKASFMWVEEIKKWFNYKFGDKLCIFTKCNCDGFFRVWKVKDDERCYDMYIDEEGYINVSHYFYPFKTETPKYSREIVKIFIRPDCIYNDNIYNDIQEKKEIKEKEEQIDNCETVLKNLKSGDIITFDTNVYLRDKRSMDKYKVLKICSKTIKCVEMGTFFKGKELLVKKERLLYHFKNYNFTITTE